MAELQPHPTTANPYNQFIPAITHEIALLVCPPPVFYVVHDIVGWRRGRASFLTFAEAAKYLVEKDGWSRIMPDDPQPLCPCVEHLFITLEWMGTELRGECQDLLFAWGMHAGRFYNGRTTHFWNEEGFFKHSHLAQVGQGLGAYRVWTCFVAYLTEEEVKHTRLVISETARMNAWQAFQDDPPFIDKDDSKLDEESKIIFRKMVAEVELVNESSMMDSYRRAMRARLLE
jgi:hypothetical protein